PQQEQIPESIFDALNLNPPGQEPSRPQGQEAPRQDNKGPSVDDLMRQIETLNSRLDASERSNMALTTAVSIPPVAPKEPVFNLENLPDPVSDPNAYAKEVASRTTQYNRELTEYYTQQQR